MKRSSIDVARRTVDSKDLTWQCCGACEGRVAREGMHVFHSTPACAPFVETMRQHGIEIHRYTNVSCN